MNTSYQKRLAAKILKCGPGRVRVSGDKDVGEALTRNDIRGLIKKNLITKKEKKGVSRVKANYIASQKKKGRRKGRGKASGTKFAKGPKKQSWMRTTRALRKLIKELRDGGQIDKDVSRKMYLRVKGGEFRNKKHMLSYLRDNKMIRGTKKGGGMDAKG
ncbi:MAG: 50S ribosomal protein L19e [Candidatus Aenigmarchaeota archaeon]|nr:50S ribosomal protein L19e [Candidatus Aenigmarchaeota archaeon]